MTVFSLLKSALPSQHRYHGLSTSKLLAMKTRTLGKFFVQGFVYASKRSARLEELRQQAGAMQGKEALVLGLGPSAKVISPRKILVSQNNFSLDVFSVNNFFRSELATHLTPNHYVLADPYFFADPLPRDDAWLDVWRYLEARPNITVYIPDRYDVPSGIELPKVLHFNSLGLEGFSRSVSPVKPRGFLSMTAYQALAIAGHLSYSRILIAGLDNTQYQSLRLTPDMKPALGPHHFYDTEDAAPLSRLPHFDTDGVAAFFEDVARLFADLHLFKDLNIENLDHNTLVDAFPVARDRDSYLDTNSSNVKK